MRDDYRTRSSNKFDHHSAITKQENKQKPNTFIILIMLANRKEGSRAPYRSLYFWIPLSKTRSNNLLSSSLHLDNQLCGVFEDYAFVDVNICNNLGRVYNAVFAILSVLFIVNNYFPALFCPDLNTTIANGKVECDRHFKRGSLCKYSCNWGFELDPPGYEGKFRHKNGTWVGKKNPPKCICKPFHFVLEIILQCGLSVVIQCGRFNEETN